MLPADMVRENASFYANLPLESAEAVKEKFDMLVKETSKTNSAKIDDLEDKVEELKDTERELESKLEYARKFFMETVAGDFSVRNHGFDRTKLNAYWETMLSGSRSAKDDLLEAAKPKN